MKILQTNADGSVIAILYAREAALIERAVTAPVKRKVMEMSIELQRSIDKLTDAKEFNDNFISTFYTGKSKMNPEKNPRKRGKSCL